MAACAQRYGNNGSVGIIIVGVIQVQRASPQASRESLCKGEAGHARCTPRRRGTQSVRGAPEQAAGHAQAPRARKTQRYKPHALARDLPAPPARVRRALDDGTFERAGDAERARHPSLRTFERRARCTARALRERRVLQEDKRCLIPASWLLDCVNRQEETSGLLKTLLEE
ncbi:hypothetical protein GGX14DRAFT_383757 [Mycena pura]|uniref:Uncharacterized protein n=1 Tax=Mycena pura TaxID=153505 RepID=A0AAD6YTZ6_9AGAR|nr:hypothetical protein GGX14DRAFT_383757 [Mycena pura]